MIPSVIVQLGIPGYVEMENGDRYTFSRKDKFVLCCNVNGDKLFIYPAQKKKSAKIPETEQAKKARKLFEKWSRWSASKATKATVSNRKLTRIGRAKAITYYSDKFSRSGKKAGYIHHFTTAPTVSVDSRASPAVFRLSGGKIRVTKRGIEG